MSTQTSTQASIPNSEEAPPSQALDGGAKAAAPAVQGDSVQPENLTGRAVFVVQTAAQGVMVRSAFLTEDKRLLDMPAIFPELTYALEVVDDLKRQITEQFAQAAQVGARVIADQVRAQRLGAQKALTPTVDQAEIAAEQSELGSDSADAANTSNVSKAANETTTPKKWSS